MIADRGTLADLAAQLEAVGLGQHQVEQHDVRLLGLQQLQRRAPSADTTVSKPRTDRLDRIRSTMFGSSSTSRARVVAALSGMVPCSLRRVIGASVPGRSVPGRCVPGRLPGGGAAVGVPPSARGPAHAARLPVGAGLGGADGSRGGAGRVVRPPSWRRWPGRRWPGRRRWPAWRCRPGLRWPGSALSAWVAPPSRPGASTGSRISNRVPFAVLPGRICPACAATIPWAIDSPRPAPALAECPRRFGSNGAAASSGGSPAPSSQTPITTSPSRPGSGRDD